MKIKEFKAAIQYTGAIYNIDLKVTEGERAFVIEYNSKFCGVVSKGVPYFMSTSYLCFVDLDENIKRNLLAIMYELAQTPLNERIWGGRMKKLKVKFTYECEVEVKPEELEMLNTNLNNQENIDGLVEEINEIFLVGDGRTEAWAVTNYTFEVEEWK